MSEHAKKGGGRGYLHVHKKYKTWPTMVRFHAYKKYGSLR